MSVTKFKSALDMPPPPRPTDVARAMAAVWERAHLHGPPDIPRGVFKYRTIAEAQVARDAHTQRRVDAIRGKRLL